MIRYSTNPTKSPSVLGDEHSTSPTSRIKTQGGDPDKLNQDGNDGQSKQSLEDAFDNDTD